MNNRRRTSLGKMSGRIAPNNTILFLGILNASARTNPTTMCVIQSGIFKSPPGHLPFFKKKNNDNNSGNKRKNIKRFLVIDEKNPAVKRAAVRAHGAFNFAVIFRRVIKKIGRGEKTNTKSVIVVRECYN